MNYDSLLKCHTMSGSPGKPCSIGPLRPCKARPGEFHPRNSPHLPSSSGVRPVAEFPRAWVWRRKPAVGAGFRARICPHLRAFGPRNSPQFRAFPLDNLSKNPVNLSNFTGICRYFRKFHILERSARLRHHTGIPRIRAVGKCGKMRGQKRAGSAHLRAFLLDGFRKFLEFKRAWPLRHST